MFFRVEGLVVCIGIKERGSNLNCRFNVFKIKGIVDELFGWCNGKINDLGFKGDFFFFVWVIWFVWFNYRIISFFFYVKKWLGIVAR